MPKLLLAAAVLIYLPALSAQPSTPVDPQNAARQLLISIEERWLHAKTAQEAGEFLAEDFVGVSAQGVIETREERLARFHPAPQPPATEVSFAGLDVRFPAAGVAVVTGNVVGRRAAQTVYVVAFSDTFCLRRGEWIAVHAQETLRAR